MDKHTTHIKTLDNSSALPGHTAAAGMERVCVCCDSGECEAGAGGAHRDEKKSMRFCSTSAGHYSVIS